MLITSHNVVIPVIISKEIWRATNISPPHVIFPLEELNKRVSQVFDEIIIRQLNWKKLKLKSSNTDGQQMHESECPPTIYLNKKIHILLRVGQWYFTASRLFSSDPAFCPQAHHYWLRAFRNRPLGSSFARSSYWRRSQVSPVSCQISSKKCKMAESTLLYRETWTTPYQFLLLQEIAISTLWNLPLAS